MSQSRKDPKRAQKLINHKNTIKQNRRKMEKQNQTQLPPVTQVPVWKSTDVIEVTGQEWQIISDYLSQAERATMAFHAVMNRNVLNGVIKLQFQKLNDEKTQYVAMSEDEQKPYQDEFQTMLKQAKEIAQKTVEQAEAEEENSQEGVPHLDAIVDSQGNEASSDNSGAKIITL